MQRNILGQKELWSQRPVGSQRHLSYAAVLKWLHLYGARIVNYDKVLLLPEKVPFCTVVLLKAVGNHLLQKN